MFNWREGIDWSVIPKTQSSHPEPVEDTNREFYPFDWREGIDWSLIPKATE